LLDLNLKSSVGQKKWIRMIEQNFHKQLLLAALYIRLRHKNVGLSTVCTTRLSGLGCV
jgi:hypothetical protein